MSTTDELRSWGSFDRDNPFPLFAEVREQGPVHAVTLADGHSAWLVVGYDEAKVLLNDTRLSKDMQAAFASGGEVLAEGLPGKAFARHMLAVDPPDHTRLRRLVASAFSLRRVEGLEPRIREIIGQLLDALAAEGPEATVDFVPRFAFPLPFTVICELLGVPEEDRRPFGDALIALLSPTDTPEQYAKAKAGSDAVVAHLEKLVVTKEREPADDLVTDLVQARDGDEHLDHGELLSTLLQLIIAGHDTTTSLLGNGVVALLRNPEQLALVKQDPALVAPLVEEVMRFDAPVPHSTFRYAAQDVTIAGVTIPKGGQVIISLAAANHDAAHFHDAETFDVTRHDDRHLAFGHGIHFCLGAPLARLEGNIAFTTLLQRFPDLRLAVPSEDLHWGHGDGLVLRGLDSLPLVLGRDRRS
ncbi:MAG TPA: cytochrome P450 [Acidimicrobiales bacterium]|nr:cytochrome P450 [Acidimicrobiales bacterium]